MTNRNSVVAPTGGKYRRWRIAHFLLGRCNPESANGIDKTVYHLASRQAAAGHGVRILSLTHKSPIPVPGVNVRVYQPPLPSPRFVPGAVRDLVFDRSPLNLRRQLVDELLADPPDVVHFHHTQVPQAVRVSRYLRSRGIPYCVTLHGALAGSARRRRALMKKIFQTVAERRHLDGAAFLHAISPFDANGARALGLQAPIEVIPNGIDTEQVRYRPAPRLAEDARFRGRRVLLYLGRLDPEQKGLDVLLDAFARTDPVLGLALVGPTFRHGRRSLEARSARLGLEDRVAFLGPLFGEDKYRCINGADFFVHPSRWEAGVPFSVLEAAACGRPCLVSPASDPDGALEAGGGALRVAPIVGGLAAALAVIASLSDEKLAVMGERARKVVARDFTWTSIEKRVTQAYEIYCQIP